METADVWYFELGEHVLSDEGMGVSISDAKALMLKLYAEGRDNIRMYGFSDKGQSVYFDFDKEGKIRGF